MLENNIYNIDREFDYSTIKAIVVKSLEKLVKEEALKENSNIPNHIPDYGRIEYNPENVRLPTHPNPLLKLKIRNTTKYLNWRIAV